MATNAADPMAQDIDSRTATLERKRPHEVFSYDATSNAGPGHSTPRKRAKQAGKLGHQDVRDFVPVGESFSTSTVPVDEAQDSDDDGSRAETSLKAENPSEYEVSKVSASDVAEQDKALVERRRLFMRDLPPDTTEDDIKQFFKGYSVENIWLPDPMGDDSQLVTSAQKENLSPDGNSPIMNSVEGAATTSTKDGRRLYVGNLPYTATVEDLREFFRGFSPKHVTIPLNSRTRRPVGYAFVTVSASDEADHAISQLSGNKILERKVSVQRARAEEMEAPDHDTNAAEEGASTTRSKRLEGYRGIRSVKVEEEIEENNILSGEVSEITPSQDMQAAPPLNWNAVNTTKIRTTFGAGVGKVKSSEDEQSLAKGPRNEAEGHTKRDIATAVALERVEGLRIRLSTMDPHDGPVSAYESTQQELHDAEVDYNYCLYFPFDEAFHPPPLSTVRKVTPKSKSSIEPTLRMWSMIEQCMKDGTLQELKEGKIRVSSAVSLGQQSPAPESVIESYDGLEQTDSQRDLQLSTITDPKQIQILENQEMFRKQSGYLKAIPNMKPGSHNYAKTKKRIHKTELHLNYCQYFPVTEDYLPLAFATRGLNELSSSNLSGIRASERRAAQIWKLVEQCTQDGTLQDLKDGRLAAWLKDAPPPKQSLFASTLQARHVQEKAQHGGEPKKASKDDAGAASTNVKPIGNEEGKSQERQGSSESDEGVILNLDYGDRDMSLKNEGKNVQPVRNSEDRDEEMPSDANDQDIKQELPAMNQVDDDLYASDSGAASNSDTESNDSNMDSQGQSEDGDAIVQYSNSEQIAADEAESNKKTIAVPPSRTARILAELSPHDLNAQLRYFHTTKVPEEVDRETSVRCLVCARAGHMAALCEVLTCSTCGAFNQHTTQACPNNAKCGKCREQGHDERGCPYKLKKIPGHELVCGLCQRNGHIEEDCELIWRTSGRPWESDLAHAHVRLSCYECGRSGHLGNNCLSRRPDKSMGTSTWDANMGRVSIKLTREIKIKGKATQQDRTNIDDSDDDQANFYRPRISVPEPVRKGQIRIVTGRRESPVYEPTRNDRQTYVDHRHRSFTPINKSYSQDQAIQDNQQYQDGGRGKWRVVNGPEYATGHNDLRYNQHRPSERRSRSPAYRDHGGHTGESSWPPPRPAPRAEYQDRRPPADPNVYRPMPSAAQNAWIRRRV